MVPIGGAGAWFSPGEFPTPSLSSISGVSAPKWESAELELRHSSARWRVGNSSAVFPPSPRLGMKGERHESAVFAFFPSFWGQKIDFFMCLSFFYFLLEKIEINKKK